MTKQEEIREGIGDRISNGIVGDFTTDIIVGAILTYLHSQGCVLKVDRELPEDLEVESFTYDEDGFQNGCIRGQEALTHAGYEATVPLIS